MRDGLRRQFHRRACARRLPAGPMAPGVHIRCARLYHDPRTACPRRRPEGREGMRLRFAALSVLCMLGAAASAEEASFRGKQVTMIVGTTPGGGYDAFTRL